MTSIIDDIQLIEEVKKRPLLFNNRYRNCDDAKEEAWAEIAQKFNARAKDAKGRWRSLRDKFVREKKIILGSGKGVAKDAMQKKIETEWPLMENMSFIWQHIVHRRKRRSKISKDNVKNESMDVQEDLPDNTEWYVALDCDSRTGQVVKQKESEGTSLESKRPKRMLEYEESTVEEMTDFVPVSEGEDNMGQRVDHRESFIADDNHYFCMSIAETLRRFPSRQRAEAKLKIQQLMFNVEFSYNNSAKNDSFEEI